ncbi:MAG: ribosome biogenesis GTPase Der [Anaplasmataceae bacterium]|nr:ribosome biogenesis GTPase Der [Anaplasmataceae bacterium]
MIYNIVIIGKVNVGKSSLFNRLTGRKSAIMLDYPGLTRDVKRGEVLINDYKCFLFDTGGYGYDDFLKHLVADKIIDITKEADVIIYLIDKTIDEHDREFLISLRKKNIINDKSNIVIAINKCDRKRDQDEITSSLSLLSMIKNQSHIFISAEHNLGIEALKFKIENIIQSEDCVGRINPDGGNSEGRIVLLGQPNSGKSTLMNYLLNKDRVIISDIAGTTRDAIEDDLVIKENLFTIVDTAGVAAKNKIKNNTDFYSTNRALDQTVNATVVLFLMDATLEFLKQDTALINLVLQRHRPVVILLNKWDLISETGEAKAVQERLFDFRERLKEVLPYELLVLNISAKNGYQCKKIKAFIEKCINSTKIKISTSKLNEWLSEVKTKHTIPRFGNRISVKIKYALQVHTNPLKFVFMSNCEEKDIEKSYVKYLFNNFREYFDLKFIPIIFSFKKQHNPYHKKK